jgi:glycosyltransferase involved in cell wall biosynthesis
MTAPAIKQKEIVNSYAKLNRRVKLINQKHSGFGKALINGLKNANKEYVAYMQADGQDLVRDLVNCFREMENHDLVLGIRGKRIDYDLSRLIMSYGCLILYKLLFNINYEDVHWTYVLEN